MDLIARVASVGTGARVRPDRVAGRMLVPAPAASAVARGAWWWRPAHGWAAQ